MNPPGPFQQPHDFDSAPPQSHEQPYAGIREEGGVKKPAKKERWRKEKRKERRKAAEAEKPRLGKEAEKQRVGVKELAATPTKEQKLEGEIVEGAASEEPSKGARDTVSRKEDLKSDSSITKARPSPLNLFGAVKPNAPATLHVLARARIVEDLDLISHPEGVTGPKPQLNVNSKKGMFR